IPQEERALRPARALVGWLSDKQARGTLNGQRREAELTDEQRRAVEQARAQVAAREPFRVVPAVVAPCPDVLREHRTALHAEERFGAMRNEGWDLAIVDLDRPGPSLSDRFSEERGNTVVAEPEPARGRLPGATDRPRQPHRLRRRY